MPRLLNALAQHFIDSGYDLKALMREIVNSDTYQLSSRYNGAVERRLGALLRAQIRAPPVGRRDSRCAWCNRRGSYPCATRSHGLAPIRAIRQGCSLSPCSSRCSFPTW